MGQKLEVKSVSAKVDGKQIIDDVSLEVKSGELTVVMGPNGAGKSTISNLIMNNPRYELTKGEIKLDDKILNKLDTNQISREGIFLSFQHPVEIPGVTLANFLRTSFNLTTRKNLNLHEFHKLLKVKMEELDIEPKMKSRFLNVGFSGGEKKRIETLQMLLLEPKFVILDEIDSGLDVDALKVVCKVINKLKNQCNTGFIIITHYTKLFKYLKPDNVYIMKKGSIVKEGNSSLISEIDEKGFQ